MNSVPKSDEQVKGYVKEARSKEKTAQLGTKGDFRGNCPAAGWSKRDMGKAGENS